MKPFLYRPDAGCEAHILAALRYRLDAVFTCHRLLYAKDVNVIAYCNLKYVGDSSVHTSAVKAAKFRPYENNL